MLPKHFDEPTQIKNKKRSVKHEKHVAGLTAGFEVAGSGSGRHKGDVQTREFKIECKTTEKESMVVHHKWLSKISREAFVDRRIPVLSLEFGNSRYYCLTEQSFNEYKEMLRNGDK